MNDRSRNVIAVTSNKSSVWLRDMHGVWTKWHSCRRYFQVNFLGWKVSRTCFPNIWLNLVVQSTKQSSMVYWWWGGRARGTPSESESVGMCRPLDPLFHLRYTLWLGLQMSNILLVLSHSLWMIFVKFSNVICVCLTLRSTHYQFISFVIYIDVCGLCPKHKYRIAWSLRNRKHSTWNCGLQYLHC